MMVIRFNAVLLLMLLMLALPSCNRGPDLAAKKPDDAPKADPPKVDVKPKELSEDERLIEKAKALTPRKVRVELIRSVPAGAAGERAEYEWAFLMRFPSDKLPNEKKKEESVLERAKWIVIRLKMIAAVEKALEKDANEKRFVNLRLSSSYVSDRGSGSSGGQLVATKNLSLAFDSAGFFSGMLSGQFAFGEGGKEHALALKMAPLDELIVPLAKEPRMLDLPYMLELAKIGDDKVAVSLFSSDLK